MPTTNPVPSTDPSDLLFNAGKLDEVVNGTSNSFTDRLGVARRTVAGMNADFDAQLADAESDLNVYRADAAASAAEALGYLQTIRATSYGAYAEDPATDPLGNPPTEGDEYWNTTAKLLKRWNGTTWQASDINTANLAASSGSSLVGYDGETVQDVLDGAKSLQDYAALRAYTGRASRFYITGLPGTAKPAGIAGVFQYDPTDTTSSDNGGTIIVGADGRRWKRDFTGAVNVCWFGANGDWNGIDGTENAPAFQAAINFLLSKKTVSPIGVGTIYAPKGDYLVNGTLLANSIVSFIFKGDGDAATTITRTSDTGDLFAFSVYGSISFRDVYFRHVTTTNYTTWTNSLFNMSGLGSGYHFELTNVRTDGFGYINKYTSPSPANEDTNTFTNLRCSNFKTFLYSRNAQAIINNIKNSTFFGTCQSVFDIDGFGHTHLDSCNIVVSGRVFDLYGAGSRASVYLLDNCKFEFWPQGGAIGTTQLVVFNGEANATFKFRGGGLVGGSPDPTVKQIISKNTIGSIEFDGGTWSFDMKMALYRSVKTSVFGAKPYSNVFVKFSGCGESPRPSNVSHIDEGSTGTTSFPAVVWEDCVDTPNLCMTGSANGVGFNATAPGDSLINKNTFSGASVGGVIKNGTTPTTFSIPHYGQPALLQKVLVLFRSSASLAGCNIKVYGDVAKTNLLITQAVADGVITTPVAYNLAIPPNLVITEGVYVEISSTSGGYSYGRVYVETMSI